MKMTLCKRILFAVLALILCLGCVSCAEEEKKQATNDEKKAEEVKTQATDENGGELPPIPEEEFVDEIPDDELLGKIGAWRGWAEEGSLVERDQMKLIHIKSKSDLDPYRKYMSSFSAEDEKKLLEDEAGACVLVELTGATENTLYGTASVIQAADTITIVISVDEVEDVLPKNTFFLLYFPAEYYNGETIQATF